MPKEKKGTWTTRNAILPEEPADSPRTQSKRTDRDEVGGALTLRPLGAKAHAACRRLTGLSTRGVTFIAMYFFKRITDLISAKNLRDHLIQFLPFKARKLKLLGVNDFLSLTRLRIALKYNLK